MDIPSNQHFKIYVLTIMINSQLLYRVKVHIFQDLDEYVLFIIERPYFYIKFKGVSLQTLNMLGIRISIF